MDGQLKNKLISLVHVCIHYMYSAVVFFYKATRFCNKNVAIKERWSLLGGRGGWQLISILQSQCIEICPYRRGTSVYSQREHKDGKNYIYPPPNKSSITEKYSHHNWSFSLFITLISGVFQSQTHISYHPLPSDSPYSPTSPVGHHKVLTIPSRIMTEEGAYIISY